MWNITLDIFSTQNREWSRGRLCHGPLARYVKLWVAHAPGMSGTFSPPSRVSDPDMHHGTCVTHVPCCMPRSLTGGFLWRRWQGKRSRHYRRMRNPQIYVPGKRPVSVGIAGCYNDNLRCHQWRHNRHCGSSRFSVFVYPSKYFYVSNQIICKISWHSVPSNSPYLAVCFLQITQKRRPMARLLYSSF